MKLKTPLASILDSENRESKAARWMAVGDRPEALDSLGSLLEGLERAEIYKFRSGEEALNCFALYPGQFELVITDLGLPQMNGIELCRRMREISPAAAIIVSTGSVLMTEQAAKHAGFSGILQKPYSATDIGELVKSALG